MSAIWYYLLPVPLFAGAMFLLFKMLESVGVTSALDFDIEPREAVVRSQTADRKLSR